MVGAHCTAKVSTQQRYMRWLASCQAIFSPKHHQPRILRWTHLPTTNYSRIHQPQTHGPLLWSCFCLCQTHTDSAAMSISSQQGTTPELYQIQVICSSHSLVPFLFFFPQIQKVLKKVLDLQFFPLREEITSLASHSFLAEQIYRNNVQQ